MKLAQLTILALLFIQLGKDIANHGTKEKKEVNAWSSLLACVIALILYYKAGLFNQIIE